MSMQNSLAAPTAKRFSSTPALRHGASEAFSMKQERNRAVA
jgi:hypothetical protein